MHRRLTLLVALAIAALVLVEPLIHSHPLLDSCAICAANAGQILTDPPRIDAPAVVVGTVAAVPLAATPFAAAISLTSRAPPTA
jgi:hypothetical protein